MKKIFILAVVLSCLYATKMVVVNNTAPAVNLLSSNIDRSVLEFTGGDFTKTSLTINGKEYFHLNFQGEPNLLEMGSPQLPKLVRSIIIPDNSQMKINIIESEYLEYDISVAPSKGSIARNIDPKTVPYTFSDVYSTDNYFPSETVKLGEPYIMRDFRGITVTFHPFRYNPVSNTLRVYTKIKIEVVENGISSQNIKNRTTEEVSKSFSPLYAEHFINYDRTRYETVQERGRMIVISFGDFMDAVQPYVDWKNQKGIKTELYDVYEMGSNSTGIKNFIQSQYNQNNGLCFVQLVGDHAQVPTIMVSNAGGGGSDASFALLEGNDPYPEVFVGRFSASSISHVQTQVERSIYYERDIEGGSWLHRGSGIASNQGPGDDGEMDHQHSSNIRDKLLDYTYTLVDEIYDPSGNDQQGINAINDGRGIINYTGHGSTTSWGNGASLDNNQINNLTNDDMLPHVISVGCVNGAFENTTCFGETWLRATNNSTGNPTGAVAFYASTVNQYWNEPMRAQDHAMDLLVGYNYSNNQPLNKKYTIGGLWYNGSCNMMDVYGNSGIDMFLTWIIFGDVSLDVRSDIPSPISVSHQGTLYSDEQAYEVLTDVPDGLASLSYNGVLLGSGYTDEYGDVVIVLENLPESNTDITLTVTGYNRITVIEPVTFSIGSGSVQVEANYLENWNLVGLPVVADNTNYQNLFPGSINNTLYSYGENGYSAESYLELGVGYVLRFNESESLIIEGSPIDELSITLNEGWNLITGISTEISVYNILDYENIIVQNTVYGYTEDGYENTDVITPGYGYWIRAEIDGVIHLSSSNRSKIVQNNEENLNGLNSIFINGKTLYFGPSINSKIKTQYSLPPKPPIGGKDIRFSDNSKYCSRNECLIEIMNPSNYKNIVECQIQDQSNWEIVDKLGNVFQCSTGNILEINQDIESFILRKNSLALVPEKYSLYPAYPNPFNPETTISFGIPEYANVSISVYNLMGQKISTLTSDNYPAGYHSVKWNGSFDSGINAPAGIYLYTIEAERFHDMRKVVLLK
ncbi:MAG: hypothetical protein CMG69_00875 [Candidatus Marinimicrobia bacterium]|nr:hypothetical protein [Candidatus Neomarinimicrobiota bacterium]